MMQSVQFWKNKRERGKTRLKALWKITAGQKVPLAILLNKEL